MRTDPATRLPVPDVSDAELAFPWNPPLPEWEEIPEDFRRRWHSHPWCEVATKLFFEGGSLASLGLTPKPGVDATKAWRAIGACLRSFAPKHEHKTAGVGFMLSEWFEREE